MRTGTYLSQFLRVFLPTLTFSFVRSAVACTNFERTSYFEPSSGTITPRYVKCVIIHSFCYLKTHCIDNTNLGLVLYNHANFYRFEVTSSCGQLNEYQFSIGQPATHLRHHSV